MGLSQVSNFFVIGLNHRITMLKTNASNLKTWRCQNLLDLIRLSLMVVALLISLIVTVISGMAIIATEGEGPLAMTFLASFSGEWLEEIHEIFTTLMLLLILAHIAGVIFSSLLQEENLVKAMITGKKHVKRDLFTSHAKVSKK